MKKWLIIGVLIIVAWMVFFNKGPLNKEVTFNGEIYKLSDKIQPGLSGGMTNFVYTRDGTEAKLATNFIQIIYFDEQIPDEIRHANWKQFQTGYSLKEINAYTDTDFFGQFSRGGYDMVSFGKKIRLNGKENYAVYLNIDKGEYSLNDTENISKMINELRKLQDQL